MILPRLQLPGFLGLFLLIACQAFTAGKTAAQAVQSNALLDQCSQFVREYGAFVDSIAQPRFSFAQQEAILDQARERFFSSDTAKLYDDLYFNSDKPHYFSWEAYFSSLRSWYPEGVAIAFSDIREGEFYINGQGRHIQAKVRLERWLEGRDFLGSPRKDTVDLEFHLQFEFGTEEGQVSIFRPRLISILRASTTPPTAMGQVDWESEGKPIEQFGTEVNAPDPGTTDQPQASLDSVLAPGDVEPKAQAQGIVLPPPIDRKVLEDARAKYLERRKKESKSKSWRDWVK